MSLLGLMYVLVPLVLGEYLGRTLRIGFAANGALRLALTAAAIALFVAVPGGAPTTASVSLAIGFVAGLAEGLAGPGHGLTVAGQRRSGLVAPRPRSS